VNNIHLNPWGGSDTVGSILLDQEDGTAPLASRKLERQINSKKLKQKVGGGLGVFTAALRLLDVMVWLSGRPELQQQVLLHERQPGWVGKNPVSPQ
jgi:hypothetical protein